jgi:hypothetical protein
LKEADSVVYGSVAWANAHLRYGISVLKGASGLKATDAGILEVTLILKEDLLEYGYTWQARVLEYWVHRLQAPKAPDSPGRRREGS